MFVFGWPLWPTWIASQAMETSRVLPINFGMRQFLPARKCCLLIEEENLFGATEDRWLKRKITEGAEVIAGQRRLIAEIKNNGGDPGMAERMLRTIETIQDLFEGFRALIHDEKERRP